ncbi:MAG: nitronate monooxygenase [Bacteroidales bacterium]|nr:nitronate monooxygenase [Bacteroidales bacterium]
MNNTKLTKLLNVQYPIIMAPMFLVSDTRMIIEALNSGITAAFPALNYRTDDDFRAAIDEIKLASDKPFGINLIVNKSNPKYPQQLITCIEKNVDFIITSLGSPREVIEKAKPKGIKVFCDVTNVQYAKKVVDLGADAIIGVGAEAGGHAGNIKIKDLIVQLKAEFDIPIISAGGVATKSQIDEMLAAGADGVSVGTVFIAAEECGVSDDYKQALVDYKANDIVRTSNLSGSPLTVINTPYVQKIGTEANFLMRMMIKHKKLRKILKLIIAVQGMNQIKKSAFGASYKTYFVAGPSIEYINEVRPLKEIVEDLV